MAVHGRLSSKTDAFLDEVMAQQTRPLKTMYPVVFDTLHNKAVYRALTALPDGTQIILGLWIEQIEGGRGMDEGAQRAQDPRTKDSLIAVTDGLKGMEQALSAVYPKTTLQTCIVQMSRSTLYARWKERRLSAAALKLIYTIPTEEAVWPCSMHSSKAHGANATLLSPERGGGLGIG